MSFKYYSLVIYPKIKKDKINAFRKKYDPLVNEVEPHISLIFPVKGPTEIKEKKIVEHIQNVVNNWNKFEVEIKGLKLSWDNWLFLLIKKGNSKIIKLHDELYSGIMNPFWRKDIRFIPHVSIGSFTKTKDKYDLRDPKKLGLDKEKYKTAIKEARKLDIGYKYKVEKLTLDKLDSNLKNCIIVKEFYLE